MPPVQSKVRIYKENEVDLSLLAAKSVEILGKQPFKWQLDAAKTILCGKDVILDVGTGVGKTLCFLLPLLLHETDIGLTVSPLSALMLNQVSSSRLATVAVCQQTVSHIGKEKIYEDIVNRKFRHVIVSPEIITSPEFHRAVFSKTSFTDVLRVTNIDEAHCIKVWGGSFRPDYAKLGILRGKLPRNVPVTAASATMSPSHIMDDICSTLALAKDAVKIQVTNARPNVALSVRVMQHSEESKADLRFIIPVGAECEEHIPISLVYCNSRTITEICADRTRDWAVEQAINPSCIAFYHALIGEDRKRTLEEALAENKIRVLYCTNALGMGCDFRNIARVVMWGIPTTFCGFVQESGRAGRDFDTDGESILIIPKSAMKEKIPNAEMNSNEVAALDVTEVEVDEVRVVVDDEGIRLGEVEELEDNAVETVAPVASSKSKVKRYGANTNINEIKAILMYIQTELCRRLIWDRFFQNAQKLPLVYQVTSMLKTRVGSRCCDNCQPHLFPVEKITTSRIEKGLKRGKRKEVPEGESAYVKKKLELWRDHTLMDKVYPGITSLSPSILLSDEHIQKFSTCGTRIRTYSELRQYAQWRRGHNEATGCPNELGALLMEKLDEIYKVLDDTDKRNAAARLCEEEAREEEEEESQELETAYVWENTINELEQETPSRATLTWINTDPTSAQYQYE